MKQRIKFFTEYLKNPSNTGSITPSSKKLKKQMLSSIDFSKKNIIVEYGPGNGIFTKDIIKNMTEDSIFILIENNPIFTRILKEKYLSNKNVYIYCDSVENIDKILKDLNIEKVDYVISSIPFLSLGKKFTNKVFIKTKKILKEEGEFIFFQYTKKLEKILKRHFSECNKKRVLRNIPPAIVFKAQ